MGETQTLIQFTATAEQMAIFEQARAKLAHVDPQMTWAELFEQLARRLLKEPKARRTAPPTVESRRRPSAPLRREVMKRDGGKCTKCGSTWALETDHKQTWALGGETESENLRLLCRNCNQREAIKAFG